MLLTLICIILIGFFNWIVTNDKCVVFVFVIDVDLINVFFLKIGIVFFFYVVFLIMRKKIAFLLLMDFTLILILPLLEQIVKRCFDHLCNIAIIQGRRNHARVVGFNERVLILLMLRLLLLFLLLFLLNC